jgi:hypothetical protein
MDWVMLDRCPSPGIVLDVQARGDGFYYRMDWPDHPNDHAFYREDELLPSAEPAARDAG